MRQTRLITLFQNRIFLFFLLSVGLHFLILFNLEEPHPFDVGGQKFNQQAIQIALREPAPEIPESKPEPVKTQEPQPVEPPQPVESPQPEPATTESVSLEPRPEPVVIEEEVKPVTPKLRKQPVPFQKKIKPIQTQVTTTKPVEPVKRVKLAAIAKPQLKTVVPKTVTAKAVEPKRVEPKRVEPKPVQQSKPKPQTNTKTTKELEQVKQSRATIRRLIQDRGVGGRGPP